MGEDLQVCVRQCFFGLGPCSGDYHRKLCARLPPWAIRIHLVSCHALYFTPCGKLPGIHGYRLADEYIRNLSRIRHEVIRALYLCRRFAHLTVLEVRLAAYDPITNRRTKHCGALDEFGYEMCAADSVAAHFVSPFQCTDPT